MVMESRTAVPGKEAGRTWSEELQRGPGHFWGGWAFHSPDLVMVMSKPTKVYVLNMCSLSYVDDASVMLFLDKD